MDLLVIGITAFVASGLTLFSGFGLGTVLLPAFSLFFPVPLAVAATAVVHFANNLFKLGLMGRAADWQVVIRFGVPGALAALIGAGLLARLDRQPTLVEYAWLGHHHTVTLVNAVVGCLIMLFAALELSPALERLRIPPRWMPVGGVLSGFIGGLAGMQGALRSAFLLRAGLSKDAFIATGIVAAVLVDAVRLSVYGVSFAGDQLQRTAHIAPAIATATGCAFIGAALGKRVLRKVTFGVVRWVVAAAMFAIGAALAAGLL